MNMVKTWLARLEHDLEIVVAIELELARLDGRLSVDVALDAGEDRPRRSAADKRLLRRGRLFGQSVNSLNLPVTVSRSFTASLSVLHFTS